MMFGSARAALLGAAASKASPRSRGKRFSGRSSGAAHASRRTTSSSAQKPLHQRVLWRDVPNKKVLRRDLAGVQRLAREGLADLLHTADGDEGHPRHQQLLRGEARRHEDALRGRLENDQHGEDDLHPDANIQLSVRRQVLEQRLVVRRRGHRRRDLAHDQRVVVHGRGDLVRVRLLRSELRLAQVIPDAGCLEVEVPTANHLHQTHVGVGVDQDAPVHDLLQRGVAGLPLHERALLGLPGVCDGRPNVCADVDGKDLGHVQGQGDAEQLHEIRHALRHLRAKRVCDGLLQVLGRQPALLDAVHDG
mmetsp:Transcript_6036/g.19067  ORF Transcript_6036/g.19067 Transcript_6036/m.19067 type:complete len:306 (+) Transcript_6036:339-1256(+)